MNDWEPDLKKELLIGDIDTTALDSVSLSIKLARLLCLVLPIDSQVEEVIVLHVVVTKG